MPFKPVETALRCRLSTWEMIPPENRLMDLEKYMECVREDGIQLIEQELKEHRNLKVNLVLACRFHNFEKEIDHFFQLNNVIIYRGENLHQFWTDQLNLLSAKMDEFEGTGSGWSLMRIDHLRVQINKYTPLKGST
jgi:hypothetical protein